MDAPWHNTKKADTYNITLILIILIALINGLDLIAGRGLVEVTLQEGIAGRWIDLLLFPFRVAPGWIYLLLFLYFYWLFGTQLELEMQAGRYGAYLLCGYIFVLLGTLFYPLPATYVFFSVFLAVAWRAPDMQILLFFIIPLRLKWAALISLVLLLISPLFAAVYTHKSVVPLIGPFLGLSNFLLFHIKEIVARFKN